MARVKKQTIKMPTEKPVGFFMPAVSRQSQKEISCRGLLNLLWKIKLFT